ncbi:MAG: mycothiol conjugate amidase Mca [Mycobacteriales bacterium]
MAGAVHDDRTLRLMSVHAHPDDESSKGAATLVRYRAEGVDVVVVTCTGGEAGSILNPAMESPEVEANLVAVRRAELAAAIEILGVRQVDLGFVDSGLPEAPEGEEPPPLEPGCFAMQPVDVPARALVEVIRRERPHVVITYDESGGYPHPDHIMCHAVSVAAFDAAGDPDRFPDAGEPWSPLKLYYMQPYHKQRVLALHEAMLARGLESPYTERLEQWVDKPEDANRVTTRIRCADYFALRDHALLAHRTQVDPNGWFFKVPLDLQREAWPTEDYELARSLVDTQIPEDDLFAGVPVAVTTR